MAKGKDGNNNNYTPIKNPELLQGDPDKRTIQEKAAAKKDEVKKDNESFAGMHDRRKNGDKEKLADNVEKTQSRETGKRREKLENYEISSKDQGKDKNKNEPEKEK